MNRTAQMNAVPTVDVSDPKIVEGQRRYLGQLVKAGITEPGCHNVTRQHAGFVQLEQLQMIEQIRLGEATVFSPGQQVLQVRKVHNREPLQQHIEIDLLVRLTGNPIPDGPVFSVGDRNRMHGLPQAVQEALRAIVSAGLGADTKAVLRDEQLEEIGINHHALRALKQTILPGGHILLVRPYQGLRGNEGSGLILNIPLVP